MSTILYFPGRLGKSVCAEENSWSRENNQHLATIKENKYDIKWYPSAI